MKRILAIATLIGICSVAWSQPTTHNNAAQRTGTLQHYNAAQRSVVIDDQGYSLAPGVHLLARLRRHTGQRVRYTVINEGGGRTGQVIAIRPAGHQHERHRE